MYAFRCKNCGHLEGAGHAGEHSHPHACRVCGDGVVYGSSPQEVFDHPAVQRHDGAKAHAAAPDRDRAYHHGGRLIKVPFGPVTVYKLLVPENWEVLADCGDARLAELGLGRQDVGRHAPRGGTPAAEPKLAVAAVADGGVTDDRA